MRLRQHPEWQAPQEQELLLRQVIEGQTTEGYTPRSYGSEQDLLLRAIEDALYKARKETPTPLGSKLVGCYLLLALSAYKDDLVTHGNLPTQGGDIRSCSRRILCVTWSRLINARVKWLVW
jgi:hypothetical protein